MKSKLSLCSGILNIIIGAMLAIDCIVLAIVALMCLLFSFSLFFLAAIPAFLISGTLFIVAAIAATVNIVTGTGAIIASIKGGKISKIFSAVSIAIDALVLPAQIFMFVACIYTCVTEPDPIFIFMILFFFIIAALCIAGITINIIRLVNDK